MKVLGIDPGSHVTGYGIVISEDQTPHYVTHGLIKTRKDAPLQERLGKIFSEITKVIDTYAPDIFSYRKGFLRKKPPLRSYAGTCKGGGHASRHP